jgi:putative ABC transport system permease protein
MKAAKSCWHIRCLRLFCPPHLLEEIEGDLLQKFERDLNPPDRLRRSDGYWQRRANRRLLWNVIRFFRLGIVLRNKFSNQKNQFHMLKSYFKFAFRHLANNRMFTAINLLGLSVGFSAFFLTVQFVSFETSFDQFHSNKNEIYRIGLDRYENGVLKERSSRNFSGIRRLLKDHFPEVKNYTGFIKIPSNTGFLFRHQGKIYNELGGVLSSDSSFFKVFPSLLISGNPSSVLNTKNDLVISENVAKKLFKSEDPIGKHLERIDDHDNGSDFVITGVLKDIPENSHLHANFIAQIEDSWPDMTDWKSSGLSTYITLPERTDPRQIERKLNSILRKLEVENPDIVGAKVVLQSATEIHLQSNLKDELESNGSIVLVYALGFIGLIILAIAWINYINLETGRFTLRIREVGVRRIIGSAKHQLLLQFFIEYSCLALAAVCIAGLIVYFFAPYFKMVTGLQMDSLLDWNNKVEIGALAVFVFGSFLVGIYPGVFLLKFNLIASLKGKLSGLATGVSFRKFLVSFQFIVSMVLVALVMVINKQLDFMRISDKKIETEQIIILRNPTAYSGEDLKLKNTHYEVFRNKILQNPSISEVTSSSAVPGTEIGFSFVNLIKKDTNSVFDPTIYKTLFVDDYFISTYGLTLKAGKNFTQPKTNTDWIEPWTDSNWTTIILNERAARELGFHSPADAIDQIVHYKLFDGFMPYKIVGVISDYHHESVKKNIFPTVFVSNYRTFQQVYYSIRVHAKSDPKQILNFVQDAWKENFPDKPFEYFFLDDYYDKQFKSELSSSRIFLSFAAIAILIAGLGIFGMTLFEGNARLKEISIRKVLGASGNTIAALLSKGHFKIILFSLVVSAPLIYFIGNQWLSNYPARIRLSLLFYIVPFVIVLLTVAFSSAFQTFKAANSNPVDHLKSE